MVPFTLERAASADGATRRLQASLAGTEGATLARGRHPAEFLAGGTTLVDLMKLDVMQPRHLVDVNALRKTDARITVGAEGLKLGAFASMARVAEHPDIVKTYPVLAQSLTLAASAQLRNMATLGGNVLQRTRCSYFRDTSWAACNKRDPGSGCSALDGVNRQHAVLGTSDKCIAVYPGDWAQALVALDATLDIAGRDGPRIIGIADLHRMPGETPNVETSLAPGEVITAFNIPAGPWTRRSVYLKIRDRQSYEFALASAAVALEIEGGTVKQVRIALGGVATVPWRSREAEAFLLGKPVNQESAIAAAQAAFGAARPRQHNAYKVPLGQETLARALLHAAAMEI